MNILVDIIIIGGGLSGLFIVIYFVCFGYDVFVLEKEYFLCEYVGEFMFFFIYDFFEELGLLEEMKVCFIRKFGVMFFNVDVSQELYWCFNWVIDGLQVFFFYVCCVYFDDLLLRNSEKNGVIVIEGVVVMAVDFELQGVKVIVEIDYGIL